MCLHCVHILLYQSLFSCLLFCSSEKNPVFFSAELFVCVFHLVFFICMCLKHLINYPDTICIYYFRCDKNPLPSIGFVLTSSSSRRLFSMFELSECDPSSFRWSTFGKSEMLPETQHSQPYRANRSSPGLDEFQLSNTEHRMWGVTFKVKQFLHHFPESTPNYYVCWRVTAKFR